jgi:hypothetical protein
MLNPAAPVADAATRPQCNSTKRFSAYIGNSSYVAYDFTVPIYKNGSSWTRTCLIGPNTSRQNEGVKQLQRSANLCYGRNLVVDGTWGPNTSAAIKHIQQKVGLSQNQRDGVYGPQTHNGSSGVSSKTGMGHHKMCDKDTVNA